MKITMMSHNGHDTVAEWDEETATEQLDEIERKFDDLVGKGYVPFLAKSGSKLARFSPDVDEDVLFVAPVTGG